MVVVAVCPLVNSFMDSVLGKYLYITLANYDVHVSTNYIWLA